MANDATKENGRHVALAWEALIGGGSNLIIRVGVLTWPSLIGTLLLCVMEVLSSLWRC